MAWGFARYWGGDKQLSPDSDISYMQTQVLKRPDNSADLGSSTILKSAPILGDYKLVSKIGQGGIAEIYKAIQMNLNREVAVKVLSSRMSSDPEIVRRFDRESITIAKLNHANIVHVIDRGFEHGRYYFVMEYVEGTSFKEIIYSADVPLATRLEIIISTLKGLEYAHKNGVIHRDVKPANILVDLNGNAKVADFGIAHLASTPAVDATSSDIIMGTMAYMSPEQKLSSANVDCTTDIYAVGVMLYETLIGEKPLGNFKLPSQIDSKIPRSFDNIIERCLAPKAKDRYQTAVEVKDALLEIVSNQTQKDSDHSITSVSGMEAITGACRYLDTIRENSYGATYLVENTQTKKLIIIKRYNVENLGIKEAKILSRVSHDNIVGVLGAGCDARKTVIVMEYSQGGSLADRLVRTYNAVEAFKIGAQIAAGLSFAHRQDVVHGNLRPSNILFDIDETPKLCDFGMPAHYSSKRNWYTPPEKGTSTRGDIYGLGVILHQLIVGKTPNFSRHGELLIDGGSVDLPEGIEKMLRKLLELQCVERYQTCDEFINDWRQFQESQKEPVKEVSTAEVTTKPVVAKPTSPSLIFTFGLVVGMALGIAIAFYAGL